LTSNQRRVERLRALREQDLARAVDQLRRAEESAARVETELDSAGRRLDRIAGDLVPPDPGAVAAAGALESGSLLHRVGTESIARLEAEQRDIGGRLDRARAAVVAAREAVAGAIRALRALDERSC
jgi:hypothetical protein